MKKKQVLIGCVALAVILVILIVCVLGNQKEPVQNELPNQQTTESETDSETPLEVGEPEEDNKSDAERVDGGSDSDLKTENQQGVKQDADDKETEAEKNEEEKEDEEKSESKPIELPFIPAD